MCFTLSLDVCAEILIFPNHYTIIKKISWSDIIFCMQPSSRLHAWLNYRRMTSWCYHRYSIIAQCFISIHIELQLKQPVSMFFYAEIHITNIYDCLIILQLLVMHTCAHLAVSWQGASQPVGIEMQTYFLAI